MGQLARDVSRYEQWLRQQCDVVDEDLRARHARMRESPHAFLRATYFRWAKRVEVFAPDWRIEPTLLAVGDCHVENFGTWRDAEARQVWGINDFDDAAVMPYSLDLVRLATSARLASELDITPVGACQVITAEYRRGLLRPRPVLLEQGHEWFRRLVHQLSDNTARFWSEAEACIPADDTPDGVSRLLKRELPAGARLHFIARTQRGAGALGRPRFLAVAQWQSGHVLREAKALVPSGWDWARESEAPRSRFLELATGRYRSPDPTLTTKRGYIVRRLAPDSRKLALADVCAAGKAEELLGAMARDIGAIHAAHKRAPQAMKHLDSRPAGWLAEASGRACEFVEADYREWRSRSDALLTAPRRAAARA